MIFGDCPYPDCDAPLVLPDPDYMPRMERHVCEGCQRVIWTMHSRLSPESWTDEDFLAKYEVDQATKTVRERGPAIPTTAVQP